MTLIVIRTTLNHGGDYRAKDAVQIRHKLLTSYFNKERLVVLNNVRYEFTDDEKMLACYAGYELVNLQVRFEIKRIKALWEARFGIGYLGRVTYFLGMEVNWEGPTIAALRQTNSSTRFLEAHCFTDANRVKCPSAQNKYLSLKTELMFDDKAHGHRSIYGSP